MSRSQPEVAETDVGRLQRRLERERRARVEAETIAENGLRALYEKQQEILLLEAIADAANQAVSVNKVLQFALNRICDYMRWPVGHVYFCGTDSTADLVSSAIWYIGQPERFAVFRAATEATRLPPGRGLAGRVAASGRPAWITDVTTDPDFARTDAARQVGLRAAFAFPVLAGSHVVAVVEFFSDVSSDPDESLLRVMTQIGIQLGRVVERARAEERLLHDSLHDSLTELPNRALFMDRLQRAVSRAKRHREFLFVVLFVDLDRFKMINDSLGHQAGDQLLVEIGRRLTGSLRREDVIARTAVSRVASADENNTLARLAGDEFAILLEDLRDPSDGLRVAERILSALSLPANLQGQEVFITASIGVVSSASGFQTGEDLLRDADIAMYRAKALGGSRSIVFDRSMYDRAIERLKLESDLRRAIERREFRLHYQPIVSLPTRKVVGFEALLRWDRPGHGLVMPADFLKVAEETGMVLWIDRWVLREACTQARRWHQQFPHDAPASISVNVSAAQFGQADFVKHVEDVLRETSICPQSLRLEITESAAMGDAERASAILTQLKALGIRLSLDDFGTGYSSLSYLRRFPIDTLKIDRSFVAGMEHDQENREIVRTIMNLAGTLGLEVIAEGIETLTQLSDLETLDCRYGQGYCFSAPVSLDDQTLHALLAPTGVTPDDAAAITAQSSDSASAARRSTGPVPQPTA